MQGSTVRALGRTRWRRFGLVFVPVMALLGAMLVMMSIGVLATPVVISGLPFTVTASDLSGTGFTQYGEVDFDPHGTPGGTPNCLSTSCHPTGVAVSQFSNATLTHLDQTVVGPTGLGGINAGWTCLKVELKSGGNGQPDTAVATSLIVDATNLTGDTATFNNIKIGVPVIDPRTGAPTFGQTADSADITNVNQLGLYTAAGTFVIHGLQLTATLQGPGLSATC